MIQFIQIAVLLILIDYFLFRMEWKNEKLSRFLYRLFSWSHKKERKIKDELAYQGFRLKSLKYERRYISIVSGFIVGVILLVNMWILYYFYPSNQYSSVINTILGAISAILGVFVGAYFQSLHEFITTPEKDVLQTLSTEALFQQFDSALQELSEIISKGTYDGKKINYENSNNEFYALLSSPVLIGGRKDAQQLINKKNPALKYEEYMDVILQQGVAEKIKPEIICLCINPKGAEEIAPLKRFLKVFSGYMISDIISKDRDTINPSDIDKDKFYENVNNLRTGLLKKIKKFISDHNKFIHFTNRDDIQWQVIAIKIPSIPIPYYKAVVGFYGEDHLRKNSILDLLNDIKKDSISKTKSYGFVTDDPDVVDTVVQGLIRPYEHESTEDCEEGCMAEYVPHHTIMVNKDITGGWSTPRIKILCDDLKQLKTVSVEVKQTASSIVIDIDYPKFDGTENKIDLKYCQYLFHPIRAESATWTSFNIRMPVQNGSVRVLDMCCGMGVQGVVSLFKGASFIHGVDYDLFSLICAAVNYKKVLNELNINNNYGNHIAITFANCFGNNGKCYTFDEFDHAISLMLENGVVFVLPEELTKKIDGDIKIWSKKFASHSAYKIQLSNLYKDNKDFIQNIYRDTLSKPNSGNGGYDLIILEPPFVEFAEEKEFPSHTSLYDAHFKTVRTLLEYAPKFLAEYNTNADVKEYETPYIMQSFSSLEDIDEFEIYLEKKGYRIVRKNVLQKNNNESNDWNITDRRYWYSYHITPRRIHEDHRG